MKNFISFLLLTATTLLLFSCRMENAQKKEVLTPVTIETLHMERKNGPDCDKPDSLRLNCVEVNFSYPTIKEGPEALKTAVDTWARDFLTGMVAFADEPDNMPPLEEAIQGFFHLHDEAVRDFPDGPAYFVAETKDTLLFNDGKYLTLKLDGYSYAGGAHPNPTSTVVTWEITAGRKLKLENLVGDLPALQKIAEQKFRQVRADDFKEGFEFDETFPFKLADNTGLLKDGIYFCYVPYEVGPYAMGYTEFVIPFIDIQQILTSKEEKNK